MRAAEDKLMLFVCDNYLATQAEVTGVNVQLSEATLYQDCVAVTIGSRQESNLTFTSHDCRSAMSYLLCQRGKLSL